jgi:hypothetical protein
MIKEGRTVVAAPALLLLQGLTTMNLPVNEGREFLRVLRFKIR